MAKPTGNSNWILLQNLIKPKSGKSGNSNANPKKVKSGSITKKELPKVKKVKSAHSTLQELKELSAMTPDQIDSRDAQILASVLSGNYSTTERDSDLEDEIQEKIYIAPSETQAKK